MTNVLLNLLFQVVVAIGDIRPRPGSYSTSLNLETENATIDFSSNGNTCPDRSQRLEVVRNFIIYFMTLTSRILFFQIPEVEEVWEKSIIKDKNLLIARLGPTGGRKGYGAITGEPPSEKSVCWWINGKLMPEIYVERGQTYFFRVQGGDGLQHAESNHPLYITSDREGGYGHKNQYERERETIYAGVENEFGPVGMGPISHMQSPDSAVFGGRNPNLLDGNMVSSGQPGIGFSGAVGGPVTIGRGGDFRPTGIGPLCELVSKDGADKAAESATFEDYYNTLQLACEQERRNMFGWVNWTVSQDTPDLVYYQSFYAYGLGWKIHVLNEGEEPNSAPIQQHKATFLLLLLILVVVM